MSDEYLKLFDFENKNTGHMKVLVDVNKSKTDEVVYVLRSDDGYESLVDFFDYNKNCVVISSGDLYNKLKNKFNIKRDDIRIVTNVSNLRDIVNNFKDNFLLSFKKNTEADYRDAKIIRVRYYSPYYTVYFDGKEVDVDYLPDKLKKYLLNDKFLSSNFGAVEDNTLNREYGVDITYEFTKDELEIAIAANLAVEVEKIKNMSLEDLFIKKYVYYDELYDDEEDSDILYKILKSDAPEEFKKVSISFKEKGKTYYLYTPDKYDFSIIENELELYRQELIDKIL